MSASTVINDAAERFSIDTAEHVMTIMHNDGLYRHLHFQKPGTGFYWFDLVTWPGHLSITGDMGSFTFARTEDMLWFFRSGPGINPGYWAEKIQATSGTKAYSEDLFKQHVTDLAKEYSEDLDPEDAAVLMKAVTEEVLEDYETGYEQGARDALDAFVHDGFTFEDTWEWDLTEYSFQYLWCCHAIRFGVNQFLTASGAAA